MASNRLKAKVLADIHGKPMIQHVLEGALKANLGPVVLACDHPDIAAIGHKISVATFLTDPDLPSGSDRIYQALQLFDPEKKYEKVINVQGDLPTLEASLIRSVLKPLEDPNVDMSTLAAVIQDKNEEENPNVVKIALAQKKKTSPGVTSQEPSLDPIYRALYFSRSCIPFGEGPHYHHIGLYGYQRNALDTFITLSPSRLEQQEKLEQLRALEAGFQINVHLVETVPLGVDSQEDLDKARSILSF
tara:strand:- start:477 stop:1214 length:738 start_codon:yes stop_codon:yes gene_type:complete